MKRILLSIVCLSVALGAAAQGEPSKEAVVNTEKPKKEKVTPYGFVRNYLLFDSRKTYTVVGDEYNMIPYDEKWNGTGYPNGLAGEDIPLGARIMAVADVFDALVSRRSYKEPFTIEKAMDIIREGAGSHFDPKVVAAFLNAEDEVRRIANANMEKEKLPDTGV